MGKGWGRTGGSQRKGDQDRGVRWGVVKGETNGNCRVLWGNGKRIVAGLGKIGEEWEAARTASGDLGTERTRVRRCQGTWPGATDGVGGGGCERSCLLEGWICFTMKRFGRESTNPAVFIMTGR